MNRQYAIRLLATEIPNPTLAPHTSDGAITPRARRLAVGDGMTDPGQVQDRGTKVGHRAERAKQRPILERRVESGVMDHERYTKPSLCNV